MDNKEKSWDADVMDMAPILFCQRDKPMSETCMCWGFECRKGWREPLLDCICQLEALNEYYWPKYKIRIQADQVKEKYGELRFYYTVVCEDMRANPPKYEDGSAELRKLEMLTRAIDLKAAEIIRKAEKDCYNTCEICGHQIGTSWSPRCQTRGWITFICDECAENGEMQYIKNGAVYQGKECIQTKEELKKEMDEIEEKWNCEEDEDEDKK